MEIAIIGLPQSGKTTLFNALTQGRADTAGGHGGASELHVGVVKVADPRVETLGRMYHPGKLVYPEIKYWDLPGPEALARAQGIGGQYRNVLQGADAFLLVVRAFTNPAVPHPSGGVDPARDLETMLGELAFADLEVLERAVQRLEDNIKKSKPAERPALARHLEAVQKVKQGMEDGIPLRRQQLSESQVGFLVNYQLLTGKRVIVAFNTDESGPELSLGQLGLDPEQTAGPVPSAEPVVSLPNHSGQALSAVEGLGEVSLCARLEAELAVMSAEEAREFREALGLAEPAISRVVRISYETVGLVSFLTVGDDEVRAWSVPANVPAQEAAGAIHSDFYRGFIRAEVIRYEDLVRCGSIAQGRKEGLLRSEGKTYRVQDGDVINFLVSV